LGAIIASYPVQDAFSISHFVFDMTFVFLLLAFHFGILVLSVALIMYLANKRKCRK
jgi:vacuolar-type H+-ATPase subunit I/STV1